MSFTKKFSSLCLFAAILVSVPVLAQENKEKPEVTQDELIRFADTFKELQNANRSAQQAMVEVVENEGLTMKRFNEIHVAYVNSNMKSDATPEEMKKHNAAMEKIQEMQQGLQTNMDAIVQSCGMRIGKYQRIAKKMRDNTELQQRYKDLVASWEEASLKQ